MAGTTPFVPIINLANSIIGVGVLAMPWCFNKCGVLLACCLLLFSAFLTYTSCMMLLRAAKATKRTSYENLAYHVLGATGKMSVELCIIGLLFCSCVSFFIIIGDLGPAIISKWLSLENTPRLRASLQVFLAVTVVIPLGLKRSVDSLAAVSGLSMVFYICFTADMFLNSLYDLSVGKWMHESVMWNTKGGFVCITITTIAFSCQTVLFTIYESMADRTIKKMQEVVKNSVALVTTLYFIVGLCGYVTYYKQGIKGDILLNFIPSLMSDIFQMCFTLSVALSFPLVIFPCRTSFYSMFYSQSLSHSIENPGGSGGSVYIPPGKFNMITLSIVILTLSLGIIVQNVETVLALTGATLGSFICFILPAIIYIKTQGVANKGTAKFILVVGLSLTIIGLYHNLQTTPNDDTPILEPDFENPKPGHFKEPVKFEAVDPAIKLIEDQHIVNGHKEPPNPHPPVDVPIIPKETIVDKNIFKEQPAAKERNNAENKLELLAKEGVENEEKGSKEVEIEKEKDVAAEQVIEQLKEKQVEQEKKIEAQAEEIEILKKQHDEEEQERKEKERQERLEREERERKELQEKLRKEREEAEKEKKEKEDAAIIEKAKEVIEQAAVLKALPQVGDQQAAIGGQLPPQQQQQKFGLGLPQDNAAIGGLAQQPQQPLAGLQQQPLAIQPVGLDKLPQAVQPGQMAQGLQPLDQGVPFQAGMVAQNVGMVGGQGIQGAGLAQGVPGDQEALGGAIGGMVDPVGLVGGGLGAGLNNQGALGSPGGQGIQPVLLNVPVGQGIQAAGLGAPVGQGVQQGLMGGEVGLNNIQQGALGDQIAQGNPPGGMDIGAFDGAAGDMGAPLAQGGGIGGQPDLLLHQGGLAAQPDAHVQNELIAQPDLKFQEDGAGVQPQGLQPLVQGDQGIIQQKLNVQPDAQGLQREVGEKTKVEFQEKPKVQEKDQAKLFDQQKQKEEKLENNNRRQDRAAKKQDSPIGMENVDDNNNVADQKLEQQQLNERSKSKIGDVEVKQQSTLDNMKRGNAADDLQLDLAPHDDDTADDPRGPADGVNNGAKDNNADVQLKRAVIKDDGDDKLGAQEEGHEQKKKVEM